MDRQKDKSKRPNKRFEKKRNSNNNPTYRQLNHYELEKLKLWSLNPPKGLEESKSFFKQIEAYVQKKLQEKVTISQIRTLFNAIHNINDYNAIYNLVPKLRYQSKRPNFAREYRFFIDDLIIPIIESIKKENGEVQLENFKEFVTALLCYHKYYAKKKH